MPENQSDTSVERAASQWLARHDRGLTPEEEAAYLQWLQERPEHAAAISRLQGAWDRLDALKEWRPARGATPNPDLLAPRRRRRRWIWSAALAAAAGMALVTVLWFSPAGRANATRAVVHPGPRHLTLEDGSVVELNESAEVEAHFTPARRAVRLVRGEAHFAVAKNAARPFVVNAEGLAVRAVGTAFDVNLGREAVTVLVTEGRVRLSESKATAEATGAPRELGQVTVGQLATATRATAAAGPTEVAIRALSANEIEAALAWRSVHLEFVDLPLQAVAEEFNRYNTRKLIIGDEATGEIRVGGNFRADNLDALVRVLDLGFGVGAERRGEDFVLRKR